METGSDALQRSYVEITVAEVRGSAPREPGARMYWFPDRATQGTIGGGNLEFQALGAAQSLWDDANESTLLRTFSLGPELGQCCGGEVHLLFVKRRFANRLLLCGAGHVATAIANTLAETSFQLTVADSRESWAEPSRFHPSVRVLCEEPEAAIREASGDDSSTSVLILTHQHSLDERLCAISLNYRFRWIGLIGSRTKWSRFRRRLEARGVDAAELDRVTCPIGNPALGRSPQEIAIGVAAQLLEIAKESIGEVMSVSESGQDAASIGGLILAGGASRRMGRWKGGLVIEGKPLVRLHAEALRRAGADRVKIVYPEHEREAAEKIIESSERVLNSKPEAPLFSSIQLGLKALLHEVPDLESVFLTPVDTIPLDPSQLASLRERHRKSGASATRPCVRDVETPGGFRFGHPVLLRRDLFAAILAADPAKARLDLMIRELPDSRRAEFEIPGGVSLTNINTPEDWVAATNADAS